MSPSPEVLVTDHVFGDPEAERAALAEIGATLTEDREALGRAEALLVCFAPVPAAMIEAAERCRIIARYGIGVDNVDARGVGGRGRRRARGRLAGAAGRDPPPARAPAGADRRRADRAARGRARAGLRFEVVTCDPYVPGTVAFADAVADADVISLHAPLTDETRGLIDDAAIALMRRAPILVNTSRGGLVDLDAVVRALDSGALGGVALDVTEPEPPAPDHACAPIRARSSPRICPSTPSRPRPSCSVGSSRRSCGR